MVQGKELTLTAYSWWIDGTYIFIKMCQTFCKYFSMQGLAQLLSIVAATSKNHTAVDLVNHAPLSCPWTLPLTCLYVHKQIDFCSSVDVLLAKHINSIHRQHLIQTTCISYYQSLLTQLRHHLWFFALLSLILVLTSVASYVWLP